MGDWVRSHLTYANVTTTILLFLVLGGGGAYALSGTNTVFSNDIVDGQVKTADLADNAVNTAKVGDRTLKGTDIHTRAIGTAELAPLPAVDVRRNSDLALNPNTPNLVSFDAESFDTADMHNGSGFLVRGPVTGIYRVTGQVTWIGNASATLPDGTECTVGLAKGTPLDSQRVHISKGDCSAGHSIELNRAIRLDARQTLFMVVTQDSNATFTLDAAQDPIYLDVNWVGPAS